MELLGFRDFMPLSRCFVSDHIQHLERFKGKFSGQVAIHMCARKVLPTGEKFVFEFRDPSWFCKEVYDIMRQNDWCLAMVRGAMCAQPLIRGLPGTF